MGKCKYPRWAINKVQNKVINGNQEGSTDNNHVGTTTQGTNTTSNNSQQTEPPRGGPIIAHSHLICAGPGGKQQTHKQKVWYKDLLQGKQDSQTTSSAAQEQGPKGKAKWSNLPLPMPNYQLWE